MSDLAHAGARTGTDWAPSSDTPAECALLQELLRAASAHHRQILDTRVRMTGRLIRVCAWCGVVMGTKPCIQEMDGAETHGICRLCAKAFEEGRR